MKILYEDDSVIVVHKEAGEATQSASFQKDIVSMLKRHISDTSGKKGEIYLGVIHRLDQPVSGVLVFAKNQKAAAELSRQVNSDIMNKIYNATVQGVFENTSTETVLLTDYIYKDSKNSRAVILPKDTDVDKFKKINPAVKVQKVELEYNILSCDKDKNEITLKIKLHTGRFHQIRAQLSNMGHPIVGDFKYGYQSDNKSFSKGIKLCAASLEFKHPKTGEVMKFSIE